MGGKLDEFELIMDSVPTIPSTAIGRFKKYYANDFLAFP